MFALSGLTAKVLAALSRSGLAIGTDAHPVISATIAATAIINQRDMFFIFLPLFEVVVYPSRTGPSNVLQLDETKYRPIGRESAYCSSDNPRAPRCAFLCFC